MSPVIQALNDLDLDSLDADELYRLLRVASRVRADLWDQIACRMDARSLLDPKESFRMSLTHPL
jgi:hypothetical protein